MMTLRTPLPARLSMLSATARTIPNGDIDPGIARAQRAQQRLNDLIARISQPPQPPHDLMAQIERLKAQRRHHVATTE
jgi:hypothetical protein